MSEVYMTRVTIDRYDKRIDAQGFEYEETLSSAVNGAAVIIPDSVKNISVTLVITGGGSGKMQSTTNKLADVISDTGVVWVDWDAGVIAATAQDAMLPATAIRMVNVSGTTRVLIRAQ